MFVDNIYPFTDPAGGVKLTVAVELVVPVTERLVGGLGLVFVVIAVDCDDDIDVPPEFVDVIVNVYEVFGARPLILIGDDVPVAVILLGLLLTV